MATTTDLTTRLHRRVGLGLRFDELADPQPDATTALAVLLDTTRDPDPWAGTDYSVGPGDSGRGRLARNAISVWIDAMVSTRHPLTEWLAWFWHGHFVSSLPEVKNPQFLIDQINLFRSLGRGGLAELTRAVTVDAAMLIYLDGAGSRGDAPNENYSRELLELFTLGHGEYGEVDVAAGAKALSGWALRRGATTPEFVPRRHDDTPQKYLGRDAVSDVDGVIAAITDRHALAPFIARRIGFEIVGPNVGDDVIERCADAFRSSSLSVDVLVTSLLDEVAAGADGGAIVSSPLLWYVAARRITGANPERNAAFEQLRAAGQVPWFAPNVSGWPSGVAWNNAATLVARFNLARMIATATPADGATLRAADGRDLAAALAVTSGWSTETAAALELLDDPRDRLTLALVSPEFVDC
jgi:uncharacterized protein (DUF1800 family)